MNEYTCRQGEMLSGLLIEVEHKDRKEGESGKVIVFFVWVCGGSHLFLAESTHALIGTSVV